MKISWIHLITIAFMNAVVPAGAQYVHFQDYFASNLSDKIATASDKNNPGSFIRTYRYQYNYNGSPIYYCIKGAGLSRPWGVEAFIADTTGNQFRIYAEVSFFDSPENNNYNIITYRKFLYIDNPGLGGFLWSPINIPTNGSV
jgi:hypothetical protein